MSLVLRLAGISCAAFLFGGCDTAQISSPIRPTEPASSVAGAPTTRQYPSNGPDVVAYVSQRHPDKLAAHVSAEERVANMEFLRDEVVRTGICGGMDLARNLKRGVGPHSIDAITWRHPGGHVDVIDIALAYDDTGSPLRLHWMAVDGPAGYDPIPQPSCQ
jgi:hypothetical protein